MAQFFNNAIFWVEVDKIEPNPFQPRREFDQQKMEDLARSIRQYGVIQPLTVTRKEFEKSDGGIGTTYELIAGERRLRAAKLAGVAQVPVIIRGEYDDDRTKLELAIIENLQREDLNPMDRAAAFARLANEFKFKHSEIAEKVGRSREYVSNTIRLLGLPPEMQEALSAGKISEGHSRPLLMLVDRPAEQQTLYREIMLKRLTVRDTEAIARRIAFDRVRKKEYLYAPEILEMERELATVLGTRVAIEPKENGGKVTIDFMNEDDLRVLFAQLARRARQGMTPQNSPSEKVLGSPVSPEAARGPDSFLQENSASQIESTPFRKEDVAEAAPITHVQEVESFQQEGFSGLETAKALDDRSEDERTHDENSFDPNSFSI